ncbi:MAG: serine/threonine-protein kinase, partial [Myxococcota bacterium]
HDREHNAVIPKVTDFGIAKLMDDIGEGYTDTGVAMGTIKYMAPEQIIDSKNVDPRADIYSLGVMLYFMATARLPFKGESQMVIYKQLHEAPPPPSSFYPLISPPLEYVILKCLEREREKRYRSCAELSHALSRALLESSGAASAENPGTLTSAEVQEVMRSLEDSDSHTSFVGASISISNLSQESSFLLDRRVDEKEGQKVKQARASSGLIPGVTPAQRAPSSGEHTQVRAASRADFDASQQDVEKDSGSKPDHTLEAARPRADSGEGLTSVVPAEARSVSDAHGHRQDQAERDFSAESDADSSSSRARLRKKPKPVEKAKPAHVTEAEAEAWVQGGYQSFGDLNTPSRSRLAFWLIGLVVLGSLGLVGFLIYGGGGRKPIASVGADAGTTMHKPGSACTEEGQRDICYEGPAETRDREPCLAGQQICRKGKWTRCLGQILPKEELCNDKDDDCDGKVDEIFAKKGQGCVDKEGACTRLGKHVCAPSKKSLLCDTKGFEIPKKVRHVYLFGKPKSKRIVLRYAGQRTDLMGSSCIEISSAVSVDVKLSGYFICKFRIPFRNATYQVRMRRYSPMVLAPAPSYCARKVKK